LRAFLLRLKIPTDAKEPKIVAATEDTIAIRKVFFSADISCGVFEEVKISTYELKLNPLAKENIPVLKKEKIKIN